MILQADKPVYRQNFGNDKEGECGTAGGAKSLAAVLRKKRGEGLMLSVGTVSDLPTVRVFLVWFGLVGAEGEF